MKHHHLISRKPLRATTGGTGTGTGTGSNTNTSTDTGIDAPFSGSNFAYLKNFMVNATDEMVLWVFRKTS